MSNQVSVIIPVRNRHDLLLRAIDSVRTQADVECETIVVDDASDPAVAKFLPADYSTNVRVLRNDVRRNAAFSRNRGAEAARFRYLAFLDSDDYWFPLHLKSALATLRLSAIDSLYVSRFGPAQANGSGGFTEHRDASGLIFDRIGDPRSSVLVCRKEFFEKVEGFDERLEKYQDWDFALRCAEKGRIALGTSVTAFLDTSAENRMSRRANLGAARRFLARHGTTMSDQHKARFFAMLFRSAALSGRSCHSEAVALMRQHLRMRSFPIRYWPLRFAPSSGPYIVESWLYLKRLLPLAVWLRSIDAQRPGH